MNYDELSAETKKYINKAIEIFMTVKDTHIEKFVDDERGRTLNHKFSILDKKVLSLFLAGFVAEGNLKKICDQHDDIEKFEILDFMETYLADVKPLKPVTKYKKCYDEYFKYTLKSILDILEEANTIMLEESPEVIFYSLQFGRRFGSKILEYFAATFHIGEAGFGFYNHPLFSYLENYLIDKKHIEIKEKQSGEDFLTHLFTALVGGAQPGMKKEPVKIEDEEEEEVKEEVEPLPLEDPECVKKLVTYMKETFVGQEEAAKDITLNIVNNVKLSNKESINDGQRSIMFIDGPTGTGKTAIARTLTKKLGVPFVATSITDYSVTGYVGRSLKSILGDLINAAGGDIKKAEKGIVVLDEFDKISHNNKATDSLSMRQGVQRELLNFLGGGKYIVNPNGELAEIRDGGVEFDTSKLTFVLLGAVSDLRDNKINGNKTMGFGANLDDKKKEIVNYTITPEDLMHLGFEKELIGRINTYLHTNEYSKEDLENILRNSPISPLLDFQDWITSQGKSLIIDDDVYGIIAERAENLGTGARALQVIMATIRTNFLEEVLIGKTNTIKITADLVNQLCDRMIQRTGKKKEL